MRRGSALLAVLWLSAALGAIAFSVATSVRGETERTATGEEDVRAYYLAQGAIERAILHVEWAQIPPPDGAEPYFRTGQPQFVFDFPTGRVVVEVIPETAKVDLNHADLPTLTRLLVALGVTPEQSANIAASIIDWRSPAPENHADDSSFRPAHASFQEIEELLLIPGITPDLFYGTYVRVANGERSRLVPRGGLRDCVSVYGSTDRFDVNSVEPAVLAAAGLTADEIQAVVTQRRVTPFRTGTDLAEFAGNSPEMLGHLGINNHTMYTFRASARMRRPDGQFSDLKRTVAALVKFLPPNYPVRFHLLRWYDRG